MSEHPEPIVQVSDDKIIYRASALGSCTRALVAARQGYEPIAPPEYALKIFEAGSEAERSFLEVSPEYLCRQETVSLPITSKISIMGHIDGMHDGRVVEIKSQSEDLYAKWTPDSWLTDPMWIKYGWQVSVYMLALKTELELVRINRTSYSHISTHIIETSSHGLEEIRSRVLLVESLAADDQLPAECDKDDWVCPYRYTHPTLEPEDDPDLQSLVTEYFVMKGAMDEAAKDVKFLKAEIEKELGPRDKVLLMSGDTVSRSTFTKKAYEVKEHEEVRLSVKKGD